MMRVKALKYALIIALFVPASVSPNKVKDFNLLDYKIELLEREVEQTKQLILIKIKEIELQRL